MPQRRNQTNSQGESQPAFYRERLSEIRLGRTTFLRIYLIRDERNDRDRLEIEKSYLVGEGETAEWRTERIRLTEGMVYSIMPLLWKFIMDRIPSTINLSENGEG